ncbi:hypothetical protein L0337_33005 [candidate division KSB1 bacterium]|nr:hypothetical protein [candidate division KSB1 bacterium]
MDIETIRERVRAGNYLAKGHAIQHALKESFERKHMVDAVLNGKIIEEYGNQTDSNLWPTPRSKRVASNGIRVC